MSPDNEQTVELSLSSEGEGCQDRRGQPGEPGNCPTATTPVNATAGSAGAERMTRVERLRDESCGGGRESPTAGASVQDARPEPAAAAVGAAHSSEEGGNDAGAKGPYLVEGNSAVEDAVMAAKWWQRTPEKVRKLQRTLYRKAKANKAWRAWSLYGDLCRRDVLDVRRCGKHSITGRWGKVARPKCAGSMRCCADGVDTSITVIAHGRSDGSNTGPRNGCVRGCGRSMVAPTRAMASSPMRGWLVSTDCTNSRFLHLGNRQPTGERSRKAGCGKPARPV
jgi:hypothetical protein